MTITPTYNTFNDICKFETGTTYSIPVDLDIEIQIISILIGGKCEFKQLILDHTNEKMFTDKGLKNLYKLIRLFVEVYGISKLNKTDLILNLPELTKNTKNKIEDLNLLYEKQITILDDKCVCSVNAKYWIDKLQKAYKNKAEKFCTTYEDFKQLEQELEELKIKNTEIDLSDIAINFSNSLDDRKSSSFAIAQLHFPLRKRNNPVAFSSAEWFYAKSALKSLLHERNHHSFQTLRKNYRNCQTTQAF